MTAIDKKHFVKCCFMAAVTAALWRVAPAALPGVLRGVYVVTVEPFLYLFFFLSVVSGGSANHDEQSLVGLLAYLSALIFWFFLFPRLLCRWGIYNPFRRLDAARPFFFRGVVALSDWWNKTFHFGRHKTGGWGA